MCRPRSVGGNARHSRRRGLRQRAFRRPPDRRLHRRDTVAGARRYDCRCAGRQAWAGTPGTVGGAVYGNAHFGGRLIGDCIVATRLLARDGTIADVPAAEMKFGYDYSRLQTTGEVLLTATFRVTPGDPDRLRA